MSIISVRYLMARLLLFFLTTG